MNNAKLLFVGNINNYCLETSYANAASILGYEVVRFDTRKEIEKYIMFGKPGKKLHSFLPVERWIRNVNRELIIFARDANPDILFLFGTSKVFYGTLITIKLLLPHCRIVWVWPDTPMNLDNNILNNARLFDLSASYSYESLASLRKLDFANPQWIPLAGDPVLHWNDVPETDTFSCDVSFVGGWRPEREKVMKIIIENFNNLKIEIHGNYWQRNCTDKKLLKRWKSNGFYAKDLSNYFNTCRININAIDDTNYPAANMRFFEIPASGGLQLSSSCPELENEFIDKEGILFYKNEVEVVEKINWVLENKERSQNIRKNAQQLITLKHNYVERLKKILHLINY
ncbi:MAG: glycosyltransferase [Ginsengibacter sp.]